jgi:hypothetical protein
LAEVFEVSVKPDLTATHRVAAWNTLCALIEQCACSGVDKLRQLLWKDGLWYRVLDLYLEQSHNARPKSSKQLLSSLSSSWKQSDSPSKDRGNVASKLVDILSGENEARAAKAALQASAHLVLKDVLSPIDLAICLQESGDKDLDQHIDVHFQKLLLILLQRLRTGDVGSATGQLISVLLDKHQASVDAEVKENTNPSLTTKGPLWVRPLQDAVAYSDVDANELRLHIFPVLFKRSFADYLAFLQANGLEDVFGNDSKHIDASFNPKLLYAALQSGKEIGVVYETGEDTISSSSTQLNLPVDNIGRLLKQRSRSARLTGLSLLITSHAITRPIPSETFWLLRRCLRVFMGDTDANFRGEVISLMQKLIDRIRAVSAAAKKDPTIVGGESRTMLETRIWSLVRFLTFELRPTASYQHHISALKILLVIAKSGVDYNVPVALLSKAGANGEAKWPFIVPVVRRGQRQLLLNLLMDPFDDVRQTSAALLSLYTGVGPEKIRLETCGELYRVIDRAESSMLASGRADHADGVAHLYALLYRESDDVPTVSGPHRASRQAVIAHLVESLEHMLNVAKWSLASAAHKYPLHGLLTSLRYVLSLPNCHFEFESIPQRLTDALHEVWKSVRTILCNDAPEGYQAEDAEEASMSTKDILSFCWRALKESSLLIGSLTNHDALSVEQVLSLSNLCFTQLAELRHRGAFSTVAQMWIACCLRCRNMKTSDEQSMIHVWYQQVLNILNGKIIINTRRSAGLPSLLCGLLIADQSGILMAKTFNDLSLIARQRIGDSMTQESSLPQVHALNCIKDVLKNTRLGEQSERYVPHSLRLAAESLRSEAWAVRNCGLMLFRAVIDRLLGTSEAHFDDDRPSTSRISIDQQPQLLEVVLDLLKTSHISAVSNPGEGIFPALQLLQYMRVPKARQLEVEDAVFALTGSTSWHIRDKAARVYAVVADNATPLIRIESILNASPCRHNAVHGALLCLKYFAARPQSSLRSGCSPGRMEGRSTVRCAQLERLAALLSTVERSTRKINCALITAAWVDAVAEVARSTYTAGAATGRCDAASLLHLPPLQSMLDLDLDITDSSPGSPMLRQSLARSLAVYLSTIANFTVPESNRLRELILKFGLVDADACSSLFTGVRNSLTPGEAVPTNTSSALLKACDDILAGDYHVTLKCEVQRFLLSLHSHGCLQDHVVPLFLEAIASASEPTVKIANQRYADQWLQLRSVALDLRLDLYAGTGGIFDRELSEWANACVSAISNERLSFYSREAAATAMNRTHHMWQDIASSRPAIFLQLCLAVYDLLNDDDEDIRLLGTEITSNLAQASKQKSRVTVLEPSEARNRLLRLMARRWPNDETFAAAALERAFSSLKQESDGSIKDQMERAAVVNSALFAEEKQNLYIDEAQEAKVWKDVTLRLHPSALPRGILDQLARRICIGLDELAHGAGSRPMGALRWDLNPDVFTFGLQIVYGVEVLLHAANSGRRLAMPPSLVRSKLVALCFATSGTRINVIWEKELRRVLEKAVLDHVLQRARLLQAVETDSGFI